MSEAALALDHGTVVHLLSEEFGSPLTGSQQGVVTWLVTPTQDSSEGVGPAYRITLETEPSGPGIRVRISVGADTPAGGVSSDDSGITQVIERLASVLGIPLPPVSGIEIGADDDMALLTKTFSQHRYLRVLTYGGVVTVLALAAIGGGLWDVLQSIALVAVVIAVWVFKSRR
jgi:hypothetical protein